MLAVVLAEDDAFARIISYRSRLHKYSVVRYRDPVKLADNLMELRPDIVVAREQDFPFHWEMIAAEMAYMHILQNSRFILFAAPGSPPKQPRRPAREIIIPDSFSNDYGSRQTEAGQEDAIRTYASVLSDVSRSAAPQAVSDGEAPVSSLISAAQGRARRH
ncbi:MAG: hypothetical protein LLF89_03785 [Spirochaetaceae bacterium]|nr:hypothetical protein [Spirochaetaceae bacterium]